MCTDLYDYGRRNRYRASVGAIAEPKYVSRHSRGFGTVFYGDDGDSALRQWANVIGLGAILFGSLVVAAIIELFSNTLKSWFFGLDRG